MLARSPRPTCSRRASPRSGCGCRISTRSIRTCASIPDFDEQLKASMLRETELFFGHIVREDRAGDRPRSPPTTRSSTSGWRGTTGSRTSSAASSARCRIPTARRRGLLGHGSILTLTSHADRTSPVLRGKWVMEVLLGTPPPPPPPERARSRGDRRGRRRPAAHGARAHGAASREPGVRVVPQDDRPDRPGARELRRHRRVADQGQRRAGRRGERVLRRHAAERTGGPAAGAAEALRRRWCARSPRT